MFNTAHRIQHFKLTSVILFASARVGREGSSEVAVTVVAVSGRAVPSDPVAIVHTRFRCVDDVAFVPSDHVLAG